MNSLGEIGPGGDLTPGAAYYFGPFRLEPDEKIVYRDGRPLPLTPKAFDTLFALVANAGRLVTKADLMTVVWPDTFVEEATLAQCVSVLRKALGDTPEGHRYIETLPKRGYRFGAVVSRIPAGRSASAVAAEDVAPVLQPLPTAAPSGRRLWWVALLLLALVIAGGAAFFQQRPANPPHATGRVLLAVLPFANLSADPGEEYLSDGLTEEMIAQLSQLQPDRLGVIARTSAMHYKATLLDVAAIGKQLSVAYVLEGSVRREGNRVRITAQLIEVASQTHVWAESYEQDSGEVLRLQSQVAHAVAQQVQLRLSLPPAELRARPGTTNPHAFQRYLRAHHLWNQRNPAVASRAIALYQEAIAIDPAYALAYAEMSSCFLSFGAPTARDSYARAVDAARTAIDIDDGLAEGHFALATAALHLFDWDTAQREFLRAEALNPAFRNYDFMVIFGHFDQVLALVRRGIELDPINALAYHGLGVNSFYARQYPQAVDAYLQAIELDPQTVWSRVRLGHAYVQQGRYAEAIGVFEKTHNDLGLAQAYAMARRRQEAVAILDRLGATSATPNKEVAYDMALVYAALGQLDEAFRWLNLAYEARVYHLVYLKVDPRLDPIRDDPRYAELVGRIGFPPLSARPG